MALKKCWTAVGSISAFPSTNRFTAEKDITGVASVGPSLPVSLRKASRGAPGAQNEASGVDARVERGSWAVLVRGAGGPRHGRTRRATRGTNALPEVFPTWRVLSKKRRRSGARDAVALDEGQIAGLIGLA